MAYTIGFYMFYQLLEFRVIRGRDSRLHFQTEEAEIYGSINKISLILSHMLAHVFLVHLFKHSLHHVDNLHQILFLAISINTLPFPSHTVMVKIQVIHNKVFHT